MRPSLTSTHLQWVPGSTKRAPCPSSERRATAPAIWVSSPRMTSGTSRVRITPGTIHSRPPGTGTSALARSLRLTGQLR
jgi:hypothetical protein